MSSNVHRSPTMSRAVARPHSCLYERRSAIEGSVLGCDFRLTTCTFKSLLQNYEVDQAIFPASVVGAGGRRVLLAALERCAPAGVPLRRSGRRGRGRDAATPGDGCQVDLDQRVGVAPTPP